jgi:exonuclease III
MVITVYTPNSKVNLERLQERILWEQVLRLSWLKLLRALVR